MKKTLLLIILIIPYLLFSQIQLGNTISGDSPYESFGRALSINNDGTRIAIGGAFNDIGGENAGHVRVFEYTNGAWSQLGNDILGEYPGDTSGTSVSISNDGTIVAIGAKGNEDNGNNAGHVRVYKYENNLWNQLGGDIDGETNDQLGIYLSMSNDGTIVGIASPYNSSGIDSEHTRVYQYANGSWNQLGDDIEGETVNDNSGTSISMNGNGTIIAIGAYLNSGNGSYSGHTRVYKYSEGSWNQLGSDIDGEGIGHNAGIAVSMSGNGSKIAIGNSIGNVNIYEFLMPPKISNVSLAGNNSSVTVTTDSNVYNTNSGSGDLEAADFIFSISGGGMLHSLARLPPVF